MYICMCWFHGFFLQFPSSKNHHTAYVDTMQNWWLRILILILYANKRLRESKNWNLPNLLNLGHVSCFAFSQRRALSTPLCSVLQRFVGSIKSQKYIPSLHFGVFWKVFDLKILQSLKEQCDQLPRLLASS